MTTVRLLLLVTIAVRILPLNADAPCTTGASTLNEKYGFRDVKLGTLVAEVPGIRATELATHDRDRFKTKEVLAYARAADARTIFGQRLLSITYLAFKGRIFAIVVRWGEQADGSRILEGFESALGCPRKYDLGRTKADVEINATSDEVWFFAWHRVVKNVGSFGEATFHHRALLDEVNEQAKREAASEF